MDSRIIESVLSNFGITQSRDSKGNPVWALEVETTESECRTRKAYFDGKLAKWKVHDRGSEGEPPQKVQQPTRRSMARAAVRHPKSSCHLDRSDWTAALPPSAHTIFFRTTNWAATSLGACNTWPYALRLYMHMLFSDSQAAAIYWGPQRIVIYNENLLPVIGRLHPILMSHSFESFLPELWDFWSPIFKKVEEDQMGQTRKDLDIPLERHGYLEETWWNGCLAPLKDDEGNYGGVYCSWVEVTRTTLSDRRTALVNRLGQSALVSNRQIWQHIYDAFADSPRDIPMAIIYGAEDSGFAQRRLHLKHTIGTTSAYTAAPEILDLASSENDSVLGSLLHRAREANTDLHVIDLSKDHVHPAIIDNVDWRGHGEPSRHLAVIPLQVRKVVKGFVVLGLNPRRDFDADHEQFVSDLARQLREAMARITTEEETQKREQSLMKELTDSERRISSIVEMAPVGIYDLSATGALLWANSHFFDILGAAHNHRDPSAFDWRDYISPEDHVTANLALTSALAEKVGISDSLRLRRQWKPPQTAHDPQPVDEPCWILFSASPDVRADGTVHSLMGCITNISHLKWAEQLQIRIADAAQRERQRQEEFIDITSHEMRNPLSAITQCADSIMMSLHDLKADSDPQSLTEIVRLNVEAAESILFCAAHQRRIIDDVLTLGKLDSELLTVAPSAFHPQSLLEHAVLMFKAECEKNEIELGVILDEDSVLSATTVVYGDSARLMQVLVNLLTNAIKFTRTEKRRAITIRFGSSYAIPTTELFGPDFHWSPTERLRPDLTQESDYGGGEALYLYYGVTDSGKGISGEFASKLFTKFEQADRRTHTKYGGSGLGLFISRELTEMQGGRIGIESRETVGSTFAFYTKARCAENQPSTRPANRSRNNSTANAVSDLESVSLAYGLSTVAMSNTSLPFPMPNTSYNILLVEDNILNQRVLARQLRKAGNVVHVANHGGEAIDFVLQLLGQPTEFGTDQASDMMSYVDCILMDWEMPVCDGLTATKRIREIETEQGALRNVIIGVTANARAEQISRAMDAGMDKVVPKPFRVPELLHKINELGKRNDH